MKILTGLLFTALVAASPARDAKEDVKAAAKKLNEAANYSWSTTFKMPEGDAGGQGNRRLNAGPMEGKAEKDGYACYTQKMGENTIEVVLKGDKFAIKSGESWKGSADFPQGQGGQGQRDPAAFLARGLRNFKSPAVTAEGLVDKIAELKSDGEGAYSGELSEEGVKSLLSFGGRGGQNGPQISEAKGSVKFWVKDGLLVKTEQAISGKMSFGQREININRTTTVEFKDVGTTKVEVPEEAKKKLE